MLNTRPRKLYNALLSGRTMLSSSPNTLSLGDQTFKSLTHYSCKFQVPAKVFHQQRQSAKDFSKFILARSSLLIITMPCANFPKIHWRPHSSSQEYSNQCLRCASAHSIMSRAKDYSKLTLAQRPQLIVAMPCAIFPTDTSQTALLQPGTFQQVLASCIGPGYQYAY